MSTLAVIWGSAGCLFATSCSVIVETLPATAHLTLAAMPEPALGLLDYRGALIPVVDVARLLGRPSAPARICNRTLVVRSSIMSEAPASLIGLRVERIIDLDRLDFEGPRSHPGFELDHARFLGPVVQTRWGPVQAVRADELFTPEQARLILARMKERPA